MPVSKSGPKLPIHVRRPRLGQRRGLFEPSHADGRRGDDVESVVAVDVGVVEIEAAGLRAVDFDRVFAEGERVVGLILEQHKPCLTPDAADDV